LRAIAARCDTWLALPLDIPFDHVIMMRVEVEVTSSNFCSGPTMPPKRGKLYSTFAQSFARCTSSSGDQLNSLQHLLLGADFNNSFMVALASSVLATYSDLQVPAKLVLDDFCAWAWKQEKLPTALKKALRIRRERVVHLKKLRRELVGKLGLNPETWQNQARQNSLLSNVKVVTAIPINYPPPNHWLYESTEIENHWRTHIETRKMPDSRLKRKKMHLVDLRQLQYDVGPEESVIFVNPKGAPYSAGYLEDY
jgi:hypothetical protein